MVPAPNDDMLSDVNPPSDTYTVDDVDDEVKELMDPEIPPEAPSPPEIKVESPKASDSPKESPEPEKPSAQSDPAEPKIDLVVHDVPLLSVSETADTNAETHDTASEASQNVPDIPKDVNDVNEDKESIKDEPLPEIVSEEKNPTDIEDKTENKDQECSPEITVGNNDELLNLEKEESSAEDIKSEKNSKSDSSSPTKEIDIEEPVADKPESTLSNKSNSSENVSDCVGAIPEIKKESSSSSSSSNSYSSDEKEAEISSDLEFYEKPETEKDDHKVDAPKEVASPSCTNEDVPKADVADAVDPVCDSPGEKAAEVVPENLQKKLESIIDEIGEAALDDSNLVDEKVPEKKDEPKANKLEENVDDSEKSTTEEVKSTSDIPNEASEKSSSSSEEENDVKPVVVNEEKNNLPEESSTTNEVKITPDIPKESSKNSSSSSSSSDEEEDKVEPVVENKEKSPSLAEFVSKK